MKLRLITLSMTFVLGASVAHAQSGYVAGSLSADVVRTGSADGEAYPGTGEALSFSLRAGGSVTSRFGVELDFTRPAEIESEQTSNVGILSEVNVLSDLSSLVPIDVSIPTSPIIGYKTHLTQRTTTITAAVFGRQEVTPRFSLVYLGGIAFAKIDRTVKSTYDILPLYASLYRPTYEFHTVDYTPGPMAGLEARIGLTEHATLMPGLRLLSVSDSWIIRPAVALGWMF